MNVYVHSGHIWWMLPTGLIPKQANFSCSAMRSEAIENSSSFEEAFLRCYDIRQETQGASSANDVVNYGLAAARRPLRSVRIAKPPLITKASCVFRVIDQSRSALRIFQLSLSSVPSSTGCTDWRRPET